MLHNEIFFYKPSSEEQSNLGSTPEIVVLDDTSDDHIESIDPVSKQEPVSVSVKNHTHLSKGIFGNQLQFILCKNGDSTIINCTLKDGRYTFPLQIQQVRNSAESLTENPRTLKR